MGRVRGPEWKMASNWHIRFSFKPFAFGNTENCPQSTLNCSKSTIATLENVSNMSKLNTKHQNDVLSCSEHISHLLLVLLLLTLSKQMLAVYILCLYFVYVVSSYFNFFHHPIISDVGRIVMNVKMSARQIV